MLETLGLQVWAGPSPGAQELYCFAGMPRTVGLASTVSGSGWVGPIPLNMATWG